MYQTAALRWVVYLLHLEREDVQNEEKVVIDNNVVESIKSIEVGRGDT